MKRALIVTVIAGVLALPAALPRAVVAASTLAAVAPTAETTADATPCTSGTELFLAQGSGCCQRQGVCGCRQGALKCCDGTTATGCPCRDDSPAAEATFTEAL